MRIFGKPVTFLYDEEGYIYDESEKPTLYDAGIAICGLVI